MGDNNTTADNQHVFLRQNIVVPGGRFGGAKLTFACDNRCDVFINGTKVGSNDNFNIPTGKDVKAFLKRGNNVIAVVASNSEAEGPAGFVARLNLELDTQSPSIVSNNSWVGSLKEIAGWKTDLMAPEGFIAVTEAAVLGGSPWTGVTEEAFDAAIPVKELKATDTESLVVAKGFKVDLLYDVPKESQGSWVNMCALPDGNLIVSDQYGALYKVIPPGLEADLQSTVVEKLDVELGMAHGLLWAFDSLFVMVNGGNRYTTGLYRIRDTNGDGQLDDVQLLRELTGGGEHGPHAILAHPDGKNLVIVCGNLTKLTEINTSRVPLVWDEDLLHERTYGRGFMRGVPAPGGWIAKVGPDGRNWELIATGFRNQFDAAFNREGELFAYDADMEWDVNTPWYRPTRICHVVSGAEFGWRNGSGKWPVYFPDSVPPVVNVGPGSPTGVCFGYGTNFPSKYQNAMFICDWSYGKLYAVHMTPDGSTYTGELEEFVAGTPLPLTDVVVSPTDGALYFTIGGRRTKSGLYRVTYQGEAEVQADGVKQKGLEDRKLRRRLESLHRPIGVEAVKPALAELGSTDRFIRYASRIALEHQTPELWQNEVLTHQDDQVALNGMLGLTRVGDPELRKRILNRLYEIEFGMLTEVQQILWLRVYGLVFMRMGEATAEDAQEIRKRLEPQFPSVNAAINSEILKLLVYAESEQVTSPAVQLLQAAPTQEEQIDYAKTLRHQKLGWQGDDRKVYFEWFLQAANYRGGASFTMFLQNIKKDAIANLPDIEKEVLKELLDKTLEQTNPLNYSNREIVKQWQLEELVSLAEEKLIGRDFNKGSRLFGEANCFACHRFDGRGGAIGPDLTTIAGRFSRNDLIESIINPNKEISDQYAATTFITLDGKVITGRVANLSGDNIMVQTNMLDPGNFTNVDTKMIDEQFASKNSLMPAGLLNTLNEQEVLDLLAFLLSRGDRTSPMFKRD